MLLRRATGDWRASNDCQRPASASVSASAVPPQKVGHRVRPRPQSHHSQESRAASIESVAHFLSPPLSDVSRTGRRLGETTKRRWTPLRLTEHRHAGHDSIGPTRTARGLLYYRRRGPAIAGGTTWSRARWFTNAAAGVLKPARPPPLNGRRNRGGPAPPSRPPALPAASNGPTR